MEIDIKNRKSDVAVDWKWPVQIGFLKDLMAGETLKDFKSYHWLKKLAHGYKLSRVRRRTNVFVLTGDIDDIIKSLNNRSYIIKTDLLVLFVDKNADFGKIRKAIQKVQNLSYNSIFLSYIPKEESSFLWWINELIYQLSHNRKIDEAIDKTDWEGELFVTKELIQESSIKKTLDKTLSKIKKSSAKKHYDPRDIITDRIKTEIGKHSSIDFPDMAGAIGPDSFIERVRESVESFPYEHETEESTLAKDINVNLSKRESDQLKTIGHELVDADKEVGTRYLQCVFKDASSSPANYALLTNTAYTLSVLIDKPRPDYFILGGKVTAEDVVIKEGKEEQVDIFIRYGSKIDQQHLMLPHSGTSTEAIFNVFIEEEGETEFEIFAFHKNRLFQQIALSVYLCDNEDELGDEPPIKTVMINMPRTSLSDFELKEQYGLSMVFTDGYPVLTQAAVVQEVRDETEINIFNKSLTEEIEYYVKQKEPDDERLILELAKAGSLLYKSLFKDIEISDQPIQIISSSSNHFPIEFVYTKPLNMKATKLCPNASTALVSGSCNGCNEGDEHYICPFGFLALNNVIERHRIGENVDQIGPNAVGLKTDVNMNRPAIPILNNTLFGTSAKIDLSVPGSSKMVSEKIKSCSAIAHEANNWDTWSEVIIDKEPDSLVIIGHVEKVSKLSKALEIGGEILEQVYITDEFVVPPNSQNKPFMVLIGCNTQDLEMSFLDFASHFKQSGAAIVLSTFTKIRGSHAAPLVEELLDILHQRKGEEIRFGDAMLELRQKLFAKGLYVSMSMVSHGDADWKLKI